MTSDAKIGLLLGLVFIFVIAFIINGLPNLKTQQATQARVPVLVDFPPEETGGIVDSVRRAQVNLDRNEQAGRQENAPETNAVAVEQARPVVETPASQTQTTTTSDVRFESPLPRIGQGIEALVEHFTAGIQSPREPVATINMDPPRPVVGQPAASERQSAIQIPQPRSEIRLPETVTRTAVEQPKPAVTATRPVVAAPKPAGVIAVVGDGESLSSFAKRVYGPEEGNKIANVERIFEANRDVLPSIHEVKAGQKLVVPALPKPILNPNQPSDVLSRELFEKVRTIGERAAAQTPVPSVESRWYTVEEGDNLWKIARSQLGAGARYEEIRKLNMDILKDGEKLSLGMKIRLPIK